MASARLCSAMILSCEATSDLQACSPGTRGLWKGKSLARPKLENHSNGSSVDTRKSACALIPGFFEAWSAPPIELDICMGMGTPKLSLRPLLKIMPDIALQRQLGKPLRKQQQRHVTRETVSRAEDSRAHPLIPSFCNETISQQCGEFTFIIMMAYLDTALHGNDRECIQVLLKTSNGKNPKAHQ